jgi:hypothetical protein
MAPAHRAALYQAGCPAPGASPSATASSATAQRQASGVKGVRAAKADSATDDAGARSIPCATWSASVCGSPASAAAASTLVSLGASGSRSLSRLDSACGFDRAPMPNSGSATMVRSASRTSG